MKQTLSLEWGCGHWLWCAFLAAVAIYALSWNGIVYADPISSKVACTASNTIIVKKLIDLPTATQKLLDSVVNYKTSGVLLDSHYVICINATIPIPLTEPLPMGATIEAPLTLIGLRATGKGLTLSGAHVTLQDAELTVDASTGTALTLTGSHHALHHVTLKGTKQAGSYGIQASGATHVVIDHSTLENFDRGIVVGGQSQITATIVRWHYAEFPPAGMAATGTEALQLLGEQSVVTETTMDGYGTGVSLSGAKHLLHGVQVRAYPYLQPPEQLSEAEKKKYLEPTEQYPGLDGVLITGHDHQLIPLVTEVDGKQHTTRNIIVGFATGIYLDGSATIRDNDITALQVGIQSDTVPTQASVLYPNRFLGKTKDGKIAAPYDFADAAQPQDLTNPKIGKVCAQESAWPAEIAGSEGMQICDAAAVENVVHGLGATVPPAYCDVLTTNTQWVLYEYYAASQGLEQVWSFEPRGRCTMAPFAEPTFLVSGASHETIAAGTCGFHCTQQDSGAALQIKMHSKIYPVVLTNNGAYALASAQHTVASLFNLAHKPTLGPLAVAPSPVDVPNLAAGGGAGEAAAPIFEETTEEPASEATLGGDAFSGGDGEKGSGIVALGASGGMKAGCSLVLTP